MRIDPGYFNQFMVVLAVFCLLAIALASFLHIGKREDRFLGRLENYPGEKFVFTTARGDTIRASSERTTVILFWSTWSDRSIRELTNLYQWHDENPDYEIIAAFVKDSPEYALIYDRKGKDYFTLADGTGVYQDLRIPGIPAAIVLSPADEVIMTQVGSMEIPVWHQLSLDSNRLLE